MIIGTFKVLEIGKRYDGSEHTINDKKGMLHHIPLLVLREATREEYISENSDLYPFRGDWMLRVFDPKAKFYKISID